MNKNIAIALIAGLIGGLGTRYISPAPVFAQTPAPTTKEIRAQSFTLVDPSDRTIGTFSAEPVANRRRAIIRNPGGDQTIVDISPMRIVLRDSTGRELWSAEPGDGAGVHPLTLR
jgi:hypothetical protein